MKDNVNYLKFTTNNTNHHEQQGNIITKVRGVCLVRGLFSLLCAAAVLFTGCFGFDERPESGGGEFVPVESIDGIPAVSVPYIAISLSGTVMPENATNKKAEWSIKSDGGTNSAVDGARLTANGEGTVTVTARIKDGLAEGEDFTQDFTIVISLSAPYAVKEINGIPRALPIGDFTYTLNGVVSPTNASYKNIVWSVIDPGTTNATIDENNLTATANGTVRVRATIPNGRLTEDYTQDFSILITKGIVAAGAYTPSGGNSRACYWIDGKYFELPAPSNNTGSYTSGIVYIGDTQYIAGYYRTGTGATSRVTCCYWVNGGLKTLEQGEGAGDSLVAYFPTMTLSIAADTDGTVYILGYVDNTRCFWKINGETNTITKLDTRAVAGLAVHNGKVYIPLENGSGYWDETGTFKPISIPNSNTIQSVAIVNGKVYMAGTYNDDLDLFYYVLEDNKYVSYHNRNTKKIDSIVEQNGKPIFYGYENFEYCYWDAEWKVTFLPDTAFSPPNRFTALLNNVVFSDGDVYVALFTGNEGVGSGYMVLREPFPFRQVLLDVYYSGRTSISGIAVINEDMLVGWIGSITAPIWREGDAISLAAPAVNLYGQTITAQGWQISDNGDDGWTDFTPPSTAAMSYKGKHLRYYAAGSSGRTYYSNTVTIHVRTATEQGVTIAMWDSGNDGWDGNAALRISVNGTDLTPNARLAGGSGPGYYTFDVDSGHVVNIYWVNGGQYDRECAFAVYYNDDPPSPMVDPSSVTTGGKVLVSKRYSNPSGAVGNGTLMGSFTVTAP